jgi:hypothetical protein
MLLLSRMDPFLMAQDQLDQKPDKQNHKLLGTILSTFVPERL